MLPRMLICTRFGLGVRDQRWFHHRLRLMEAVTAPSLRAQTNQDFHWAIFIDPDLNEGVRQELLRIAGQAFPITLHDSGRFDAKTACDLAIRLGLEKAGYMLTARIDDDDAWARDTVQRVYGIAGEWLASASTQSRPGIGITFASGLEWVMSDLIDIDKRHQGQHVVRRQSIRPYDYPFHSMSCFVLSAMELETSAISTSHSKLAAVLADRAIDILIDRDVNAMWLYTRHKQVDSGIQKSSAIPSAVDLQELEDRFGINEKLVIDYIAHVDTFGYVTAKRSIARRTELKREIAAVDKLLARHAAEATEATTLRQRRDALEKEWATISADMVEAI